MTNHDKLDRKNVEDILTLSPMQEGMLFQYLLNPESKQYFEKIKLTIEGTYDFLAIDKAWQKVQTNNEMLRTIFRWDKLEKSVQIVLREQSLNITEYDLSHLDSATQMQKISEIAAVEESKGFDLENGPLFRVCIIHLTATRWQMTIYNHHIIYDGWSNGILLQEFFQTYASLLNAAEPTKETKTRFKTYLRWLQSQNTGKHQHFWRGYLKEYESKQTLPLDKAKVRQITSAQNYFLKIPADDVERIKKFVSEHKLTQASFFYTLYGILLQKYNNSKDLLIGTTVSGRPADIQGIEQMVGLFINTLPLRIVTGDQQKVSELLHQVQSQLQERQQFETTPLLEVKSCSEIGPKEELFDTIVVVENYPLEERLSTKDICRVVNYETAETTNYDLTLAVMTHAGIELNFSYNPEVFEEASIQRMGEHLTSLLHRVLDEPDIRVQQIEIISPDEKELLLHEWNNTQCDFPRDKTIYDLFAEHASLHHDELALILGDSELTYGQLLQSAEDLAQKLHNVGVTRGSIVAIMLERSFEMIAGILAVWRAGGAYLPITPDYPVERIEFILSDSGASHLLTSTQISQKYAFRDKSLDVSEHVQYPQHLLTFTGTVLNVTVLLSQNITTNTDPLPTPTPDDLAYIIYTSGSTGKPKGVMIEHHSLTNTIYWRKNEYQLTPSDHVLQLFSFIFDGFLTSFFTPLISGAPVILTEESAAKDPLAIKDLIVKHQITHFIAVPSLYMSLLEMLTAEETKSLRIVTLAGEQIHSALIARSKELNPDLELVNEYGPTENCVAATIERNLRIDTPIRIGLPIANTQAYVLNSENQLMPIGIAGELCLSGEGTARGYLNLPELTGDRFIENRFSPHLGRTIYRTGDLARWHSDGRLEIIGRVDHQIKLRGFRIEPGEVEAKLLSNPAVREAAVVAVQDEDGSNALAAYIHAEISLKEIQAYLESNLPEYMVPTYFVQVDKLPLNSSGKLDRHSLPKPERLTNGGTTFVAPSSATEIELAKIWQSILHIESISVDNDFFKLGGHSLKATTLVAKIYKAFEVRIPLSEIFKHPTIREQAELIENLEKKSYHALTKTTEADYYPVSSAQKRLYLLQQMDESSVSYNMPGVLRVEGHLDYPRLIEAFKTVIKRHESLRTCFVLKDGEPVQQIVPNVEVPIQSFEASPAETAVVIERFVQHFDLKKAPLFRIGLVEMEKYQLLLFDMHHIISDGVSMNIFIQDVLSAYHGKALPELSLQYRDYAVWQQSSATAAALEKEEEYWLQQFSGEIPVLTLPTDKVRPKHRTYAGDTVNFTIEEQVTKALHQLAERTGTTLYMVLLSAYNLFLAKMSGQDEIIVGTPTAGRTHPDLEHIIGLFVNTLALRTAPTTEKAFLDYLQEVKDVTLQAFENQSYQFDQLVEKLNLSRDISRHPLFDTVFALQNEEAAELSIAGVNFTKEEYVKKAAKFDLTLNAEEKGSTLSFALEYSTELFQRSTIERMIGYFRNILQQIASTPEERLARFELLTPAEKLRLINDFNPSASYEHPGLTLQEIIEERVQVEPEKVAIEMNHQALTYQELNQRANQLARTLRENGVQPNESVGLLVERSFEMIISILAILKAGGAYLPIDPDYPEARISYLLSDSGAKLLLTSGKLRKSHVTFFTGTILEIDDTAVYHSDDSNLPVLTTPENLAYIMYTSGTTGKPKGILTRHDNIVRIARGSYIDLKPEDRILQLSNYAFDGSTFDLYAALLNGATLVLLEKDLILNVAELAKFIKDEKITVFFVTTALFNALVEANLEGLADVRKILFGGERVSVKHVRKALEYLGPDRILHVYGPTESTVFATAYAIDSLTPLAETAPIGAPISGTRAYIVGKAGELQPIGVTGEVWIAGQGLADGYLNRPDLTAEKFIADPFFADERVYRSGDLGRWLADGSIEFVGRIDKQVKLRGFRIELGEIESELASTAGIREVLVIDRINAEGNKYLAAYYVADEELSPADLRSKLAESLPEFMIPTYFIRLEQMPLTPNGKIDTRQLPEPDYHSTGVTYEAPTTDIEKRLATIWSNVLNIPNIGLNDNFFNLGGHSLKAATLMKQVILEFGVELPLSLIFKQPSFREIAQSIAEAKVQDYQKIERTAHREYHELTSAQKRLFILNQLEGAGISYNIPTGLKINGPLNTSLLSVILKTLTERHESLRTSFAFHNGRPMQKIHTQVEVNLTREKGSAAELEGIISQWLKPFDLSQPPLFRALLVETENPVEHYLLFDMHHIISDGVSMHNLIGEFATLYQGGELSDLPLQYRDFAEWQNEFFASEGIEAQERYWLEQFTGEIPRLHLPLEKERSQKADFTGKSYAFTAEAAIIPELKKLGEAAGATLFMILLTCYYVLLAKSSGDEDVVIGTPVTGRNHPDVEPIIGMFVNTLALRSKPESKKPFAEFLHEVKDVALQGFQHSDYQLEMLADRLELQWKAGQNPLFDTLFTLQNEDQFHLQVGETTFTPLKIRMDIAKFDLSLTAFLRHDELEFSFEYRSELLSPATIERMAKDYLKILHTIVENPEIRIGEIELEKLKKLKKAPIAEVDFNF